MDNQLRELTLSDIVNTIKKGGKTISFLFFVGLIIGVAWFFLAPLKYEGTTTLQVGRTSSNKYIEDSPDVVGKTKNGVYGVEVSEVDNIKDTSLVRIIITGKDYDKVKEDLNAINKAIIDSHEERMKEHAEQGQGLSTIIEREIERIEDDISFLLLRGQQVAALYLKLNDLQAELERIDNVLYIPTKVVAEPDIKEVKPSVLIPLLSAALGLFLGFAIALVRSSKE